ncbi:MAG: D-isomer specific 2-hydroxyacid dehydrogenase NAD-binding protein [Candidatus Jorgensenbacteria bacterium GW2011_GWC1_48_8]|uniref:D-isomer specific 2-hydroxyacid dehydrogenase NAD-binding protein n=1 Tax=Candidatus Jorgensenbacteria bacterium GW2011_GWC1_48_8 TaxID=1618666 RepID=A0A0G1X9I4_9BACT|nr:MAG: D-isomer specific 2-hydroxyacid dehydrogenase NAD-binding protein [Candidatus Jorgensenbacteria bacterium GW2011_GWC1_48_8]
MRIAFFEIEEWEKPRVRGKFGEDVYLDEKKVDEDELSKENDFEIISIFVDSRITEKVLAHFPNLKFIATRSTGFDHIDLAACKKRNISVSYVPGYGDIKIAKGFGMKVIASDPYPDEKFAKEENFEYVSLEKLLSSSDIITVHCPYNEKTRHLINKENIRLIKKGAYLINTARGGIVETDALAGALEEGILAGAGLDVLEEEGETKEEMEFLRRGKFKEDELKTMLQNHMLMRMPNVLITPHNAFNSREALERILGTTLENIEGFLSGGPVNLVP